MKKILNLLILFILLSSVSLACSITLTDKSNGGKCVDVGGYQLYARTFGKSKPVVIFDSGSGDDSTVWEAVTPQVSQFSSVVVYDRAGLGKSDQKPGDNPISSQDSVNSLRLLLIKQEQNRLTRMNKFKKLC